MYKTKQDIDAYVRLALPKVQSLTECHLLNFSIAKLYYEINEFATAKHYLCMHLSFRKDNDHAHKLLGQCYQHLEKPDKALQAFQRSLQLNPKQSDILAEVCQLLLETKNLNTNKAKYWCELAESEKVQHEAVFSLRNKLMNKHNFETNQTEELIQKEIAARPNDVQLRVRLVRNYVEKNQILDAFKYVHQLEMSQKDEFVTSAEWYNVVWLVLNKYEQMPSTKKEWDFWLLLIMCLERQVQISISLPSGGGVTEVENLLFNLDQYLFKISQLSDKICAQKKLVDLFHDHYSGQLLLHATALILKRRRFQNKSQWKETTRVILPLLMLAYQSATPNSKEPWMKQCDEQSKQLIALWQKEGSFRCAQVGRTLLSCVDDNGVDKENVNNINNLLGSQSPGLWQSNDELLNQVRQTCSDRQWKRNIFALLFCNSDQKAKEQSSLFAMSQKLTEPIYEMPSYTDVECYEVAAQYLRPQSLQHMVYLCLGNENLAYVKAKYFSGLNCSTQKLSFCGAESLNQLDVDSFLYAATIQAKRVLEVDSSALGKPKLLPFANIHNMLCTKEQSQWWSAAYIVYKNLSSGNDLMELRATLQYGVEAVRGINGPKMDMAIAFKLGQIFVVRAQEIVKPIEKEYLEARAESIYKYGLNMMKMHNKGVLEPFRKYFKYVKSQTSAAEHALASAAEDAVSYLATRYFKISEYEDLIEELSGIQLPFATYLQAEAYRQLDETSKAAKKTKRMYLDRASECLNQTLALLKSSAHTDPNHPLNLVIHSDIKQLQQTSARYLNDSNTNFNPITSRKSTSTSDDKETNFYNSNSVMPPVYMSNTARLSGGISSATATFSSQNQEIETPIKQIVNIFTIFKDEIINDFKSELQNITKEICTLKDKISSFEEAMSKMTKWNDQPYQKRQQMCPAPQMCVSQSCNNDGSITNRLDTMSNSPLMPQQQCIQAKLPPTNSYPLNYFSHPNYANPILMTPPPDDYIHHAGKLSSLTHLEPVVPVSSATVNFIMPPGFMESNRSSNLLTPSITNITSLSSLGTPRTRTLMSTSIPAPSTITITTTTAQSGTQSEANETLNRISDSNDYKRSVTEEIEYDSRPDFKLFIPLPDKIKVRIGEEDEEVMFCHRAKLFRLGEKEWRECGIGDIKILKNKEGTSRILMRRDQIHKICANHSITPELILTVPKNETKGFIWVANDFSDESLQLEMFFVCFKLPETSKQFQEAFKKAQKEAEDKQSAIPDKNVEKPKVASTLVTNTATLVPYTAPSSISTALTSTVSSIVASLVFKTKQMEAARMEAPAGTAEVIESPANISIATPTSSQPAKSTLDLSEEDKKPAIFGGAAAALNSSSKDSVSSANTTTSKSLFGGTYTTSSSMFGGKPIFRSALSSFGSSPAKVTNKSIFGSSGNTSQNAGNGASGFIGSIFSSSFTNLTQFGNLIKESNTDIYRKACDAPKDDAVPKKVTNINILVPFNPTEKFYFGLSYFGATKPVVANKSVKSLKFTTPRRCITTPHVSSIPKGEEVMFYHNGRLFHVKDMTWKDNSIGDITILKSNDGTSRILIRRDETMKVCANHKITHELTLNVPKNKTKGFSWTTNDFTEGSLQLKTFYVYFELSKPAEKFQTAFKKAQQEAKDIQSAITSPSTSNTGTPFAVTKSTATNLVTSTQELKNEYSLGSQTQSVFGKPIFAATATALSTSASASKLLFSDFNLSTKILSPNVNSVKSSAVMTTAALPFANFTFKNWNTPSGISSISTTTVSSTVGSETGAAISSTFASISTQFAKNLKNIREEAKEKQSTLLAKKVEKSKVTSTQKSDTGWRSALAKSTATNFVTSTAPVLILSPVYRLRPQTQDVFGNFGNLSAPSGISSKSNIETFADWSKRSIAASTDFSNLTIKSNSNASHSLDKTSTTFADLSKTVTASSDFASLVKANTNTSLTPKCNEKCGFKGLTNQNDFLNFGKPLKGLDNLDINASVSKINASQTSANYNPIIELPNEIVVSTTEEEENKLFGERAFLFRWDATNKQDKESGVGELKILLHPVKRNYRLVMRCVQIQKLVLNHAINADFHFDNMNSNPKSFVWETLNYAESNKGQLEKLTVRFCKLDRAEAFSKKLRECIDNCKEREKGN